ncbi:MAG: hypothetical protein JSW00_03405 [Thermoplasmata archaeon]|nr:MAG: hypothetical protein JSW00_03405 [Thermoplasmata archaeon]
MLLITNKTFGKIEEIRGKNKKKDFQITAELLIKDSSFRESDLNFGTENRFIHDFRDTYLCMNPDSALDTFQKGEVT